MTGGFVVLFVTTDFWQLFNNKTIRNMPVISLIWLIKRVDFDKPAPFFIQRSIEGLIVKLTNQFIKEIEGSFSQCRTIWFYWITNM
jgi:hypothetical protein